MKIPDDIILEIKYKNDIESVISPYVNLKRAGKNLVGLCPFHSEKSPSFTVYPDSNSYYCFGCGAGGDAVTFVRSIENLDYYEALKQLAARAGVTIPEGDFDDSMSKLKSRILEINRESAKFFNSYLFTEQGKWALDYLTDRGLTVPTIRHFGLGVAPDGWDHLLKYLKSKGFSLTDLEQANVITKGNKGYYDRFRNKVMFPIIDLRGNVIAFSGRARPGDESKGGKYINTSDTLVYKKSHQLFGLNFAKSACSERILLVEGNMDVISLHQAGFVNTVAALGTSFTDEQARILSRYTKEVVLTLDSDAAGQKATARALEVLNRTGLAARVVTIPEGKDPDEFIKKMGPERFSALLEGAVSNIEYKLFKASEGLDLESNDGRLAFLTRAAEILAGLSDSLAADMYAGRIAEKYGVSKSAMLTRVKEISQKQRKQKQKSEIKQIITPVIKRGDVNPDRQFHLRATKAEEALLAVLIKHQDALKQLDNDFTEECFVTSLNKRIFDSFLQLQKENRPFDLSLLGNTYTEAEQGYIISLQNGNFADTNYQTIMKDAINVLKEEKDGLSAVGADKLSSDDWAKQMQNLIQKKTRGE